MALHGGRMHVQSLACSVRHVRVAPASASDLSREEQLLGVDRLGTVHAAVVLEEDVGDEVRGSSKALGAVRSRRHVAPRVGPQQADPVVHFHVRPAVLADLVDGGPGLADEGAHRVRGHEEAHHLWGSRGPEQRLAHRRDARAQRLGRRRRHLDESLLLRGRGRLHRAAAARRLPDGVQRGALGTDHGARVLVRNHQAHGRRGALRRRCLTPGVKGALGIRVHIIERGTVEYDRTGGEPREGGLKRGKRNRRGRRRGRR
mmetsp:Transcript_4123/g.9823  ORF Transcript_4123/g.9823 Transcript_4123/m.9823 type:complete len:259 (+) Transcript_4123:1921-2697(+)